MELPEIKQKMFEKLKVNNWDKVFKSFMVVNEVREI